MNHNKLNKEAISHIITGVVVTLKGIDKMSYPEKFWLGLGLLIIGLSVLAIGVFHHQIENRISSVKSLVFIAEAFVMIIVGYIYWHENKNYIQYVCFASAIGFSVASVLNLISKKR